MLHIERNQKALTHAFANLSTTISFQNMQSFFDTNHSMESALTTLLNKLFRLSLINLNTIKHNHPAIDLGDSFSRIAVQVTSDGSNSKFNETLDLYTKHSLDSQYDEVWFLIISNFPKGSISRKGLKTKVMNLGDLAKLICEKDEATFNQLFEYCKEQFSTYFSNDYMTNPLEVKPLSSTDLSSDISNFIKCNKLDVDIKEDYTTLSAIKSDLQNLKEVLASMNDGQRWFIFRVLSEAKEKDDISGYCIPLSVLENGLRHEHKQEVYSVFKSLEHKNMAWYAEEDYRLEPNSLGVCFKGSIEDFDYFSAILEYLISVGRISDLKKIIIERDFSCIN